MSTCQPLDYNKKGKAYLRSNARNGNLLYRTMGAHMLTCSLEFITSRTEVFMIDNKGEEKKEKVTRDFQPA